jgi:hypothetical protein
LQATKSTADFSFTTFQQSYQTLQNQVRTMNRFFPERAKDARGITTGQDYRGCMAIVLHDIRCPFNRTEQSIHRTVPDRTSCGFRKHFQSTFLAGGASLDVRDIARLLRENPGHQAYSRNYLPTQVLARFIERVNGQSCTSVDNQASVADFGPCPYHRDPSVHAEATCLAITVCHATSVSLSAGETHVSVAVHTDYPGQSGRETGSCDITRKHFVKTMWQF